MEKSPDAFRTISEAADELDLPQHVLRFWETRFAALKPLKRGGGRRYYRPQDVLLLKGIRNLLYEQGLTIKGVQKILKEQGVRQVMALGAGTAMEFLPELADEADDPESGSLDGALALPAPADVVADDEDDGEEDESPVRSLFGLPGRKKPKAGGKSGGHLSAGDRETLQAVLKELLELKRLLDRSRGG